MLFLYTQAEKESVKEYGHNFKSLWDMVEAFRGLPGLHRGLVDGWLADLANRVTDPGNPFANEKASAKTKTAEAVKATLLISGANKQRYGKLNDELANSYLLGLDYYPNTCKKALQVLGNYKATGRPRPPREKTESRVAFLQQGGQGRGGSHGGQGQGATGQGRASVSGADARGGASGGSGDRAPARRTNQAGDSHCYNCGSLEHWGDKCPELSSEQQAQLHMAVEGNEEQEEVEE